MRTTHYWKQIAFLALLATTTACVPARPRTAPIASGPGTTTEARKFL